MKSKKNFTPYWIMLLGAILTVPAASILLKRFAEQPVLLKAVVITIIYFVLAGAITLLYRHFFNVTMDEIIQDTKVTELNRKKYWLLAYRRKQQPSNNSLKRLLADVSRVISQVENFERRRDVFYHLFDGNPGVEGGTLKSLADLVEKALDFNTDKIIDWIKIFDDRLSMTIVQENLGYIEEYIAKNDGVLADFEKLIVEVSGLDDSANEVDVSRLKDMIQAMESLRIKGNRDLDNLKKKYE